KHWPRHEADTQQDTGDDIPHAEPHRKCNCALETGSAHRDEEAESLPVVGRVSRIAVVSSYSVRDALKGVPYFESLLKADSLTALFRVAGAAASQDVLDGFVPFVARILEHLVRVVAHERNRDGPWLRVVGRIINRHAVVDVAIVHAREAFDGVELFALRNA